MTTTRELPIIFSAPMVRAILAGRKSQTRRVVKPQPVFEAGSWWLEDRRGRHCMAGESGVCHAGAATHSPYWGVSRLWVRETWAPAVRAEDRQIAYAADGRWCSPSASGQLYWHGWISGVTDKVCPDWQDKKGHWVGRPYFDKWRPSIHMHRSLSRLTLEIVNIRVERLQDISEADAKAEGVEAVSVADVPRNACWTCRQDFAQLWDKLNSRRGFGWESDPWVWVIEFRRIEQ